MTTLTPGANVSVRTRTEAQRSTRGWTVAWVVCAAVVVVAIVAWSFLGMRLVWLETGSMSPTYPTGSVLLVRQVPAAAVVPRDVVTVTRPNGQLVTHRVVATEASGTDTALTLQGDDNPTPDSSKYVVTSVGLVLTGLPFGGEFIKWATTPVATQVAIVLLALAVMWGLWPTPSPRGRHVKRGR